MVVDSLFNQEEGQSEVLMNNFIWSQHIQTKSPSPEFAGEPV